jgi:formylglycine-generating enzyme
MAFDAADPRFPAAENRGETACENRPRDSAAATDISALQLVPVPGGTVELRDARSGSRRQIALHSFKIGKTPVTWADWNTVFKDLPERSPKAPAHPVTWFDAVRWCNEASALTGFRPVYRFQGRRVLWDVDADGFRLPTEAEWEWACRAGSLGPRYGALPDIGWTAADQVAGPQDVAGKAPNAFGLFDMIGNVWEWCWDYADPARYGDYRSLRGGGWADREWSCRASVRRGSAPDAVLEDAGFRVARGPTGKPGAQAAQGWSAAADHLRANIRGPLPLGWTPLRD